MLGDPKVLMFDEPVNGLDPEGILWIRNLMKALAAEGRTVFVSSHLMSEMEYTADHLIVIGRGKLIADCSMSEFISRSSGASVRVRTPMADELIKAVTAKGATAATGDEGAIEVRGMTAAEVGDLAFEQAIRLHELATVRASLEEAFMELTASSVEYRAEVPGSSPRARRRPSEAVSERWPPRHAERAPVRAPARRRAGGTARRARVGVHQDPLGPLHLLDAGRAVRRLRRPRGRDHCGHCGQLRQ